MCFVIVKRNQYPKQGDVRDEDGQVGEIGHPRDPHKSGCKIFSFSNTSIKRKKKSHHATQTPLREGKTPDMYGYIQGCINRLAKNTPGSD